MEDIREKQRMHLLREACLDGCRVDRYSDNSEVDDLKAPTFNNLRVVSIRGNLISSYEQLLNLLKHLPNLTSLNASDNYFGDNDQFEEEPHVSPLSSRSSSLPRLRVLVVNNSFVQLNGKFWGMLDEVFVNLEELYLAGNSITSTQLLSLALQTQGKKKLMSRLKILDLSRNLVESLEDVFMFCSLLPNVERLQLSDNPMSSFIQDYDAIEAMIVTEGKLSKLKYLGLNMCKIASVYPLLFLHRLPALSEMRFSLQSKSKALQRSILVANLPYLRVLNGSPLSEGARKDQTLAFAYFLKQTNSS